MRTPAPLPDGASTGSFLSRDATRLGISGERLRRRDIRHPHHGLWTSDEASLDVDGRCREWAPLLLPGQVFSHQTALALMGAPLPHSEPLHLSVLFPRTPPRGEGIRGHSLRRLEWIELDGLPVSTPTAAWLDAAADLGPSDVVVIADFLLTSGRVTPEALAAEVRARSRAPGAKRATWAASRARAGARSRPETVLRLGVVAAGLPEPVIEFPIVVQGGVVLHPDLAFVRERVVLEYEGDGHRTDREQWMRDLHRRELLEAAGWKVVRVTARDLYRDWSAFVDRLRGILDARSVRAS